MPWDSHYRAYGRLHQILVQGTWSPCMYQGSAQCVVWRVCFWYIDWARIWQMASEIHFMLNLQHHTPYCRSVSEAINQILPQSAILSLLCYIVCSVMQTTYPDWLFADGSRTILIYLHRNCWLYSCETLHGTIRQTQLPPVCAVESVVHINWKVLQRWSRCPPLLLTCVP